ncbi:hypothetical protein [Shimia sp.]|uniref:hypothetical protein n=1 Tax=Shimia sp. TaxID=1954381 RepID=UPI003B8DC53A
MSDISDLEGRLSTALERIARGVDAMQPVVGEPEEGEDVQALRRALENEALVTAQMEERVRVLTTRQTELETELSAAQEARTAAEDTVKDSETAKVAVAQDLLAAQARAEAAETAAAAAAEKLEALENAVPQAEPAVEAAPAPQPEPESESRVLLEELAKRLRRLRQMVRRERGANKQLRDQVEKDGLVELSAVEQALKADLATLTALRDAELTETALILEELRPLVHGVPEDDISESDISEDDALEDATSEGDVTDEVQAPDTTNETGEA